MAHELYYNEEKKQHSVMVTKTAWHKLGTVVDGAQTSEQAISIAGLDYGVSKRPLYTNGPDDSYLRVPDRYATVRMDTDVPLGVVGERYTLLQNKDAFKFIDEIIGTKEAVFETAGALGRGERVFISCKLPEKLVVGLNDVADNYFFLTNSHDASAAVSILFTSVFTVCANTVRMALQEGKRKQSVRHTQSVNSSLFKAADLMGITRQNIQEKQELFNQFTKVRITDKELRKYIETVMMPPSREQVSKEEFSTRFTNIVDKVFAYAVGDPAQQGVERKGTLWGATNAITGYFSNIANFKTGEDRLNSIMNGNGNLTNTKALELATGVLKGKLSLT